MLPRRQRRLSLTAAGETVLQELRPQVDALYAQLMRNLAPAEQQEFMRLLRKFVDFQG
jgi:DNA-binding MarR family transcriptional regulator